VYNKVILTYFPYSLTNGGGLAQLVATLVGSTKLLYAGPGQRAVMLCDWGVNADMVLFAGNTV